METIRDILCLPFMLLMILFAALTYEIGSDRVKERFDELMLK